MESTAWEGFISDIADVCQQFDAQPWQTSLKRTLVLLSELSHSETAALLLLDETHHPMRCLQTNSDENCNLCAVLQSENLNLSKIHDSDASLELHDQNIELYPIGSENRIQAILALSNAPPPTDAEHLTQAVAILSPLIRNAQFNALMEASNQQRAYMEGLNAILNIINRANNANLEQTLKAALVQIIHITGLNRGGIYLPNQINHALRLYAYDGLTEENPENYPPVCADQSPQGQAYINQQVIIKRQAKNGTIEAQINLPLITDDEVLGVLSLSPPEGQDFSPEIEKQLHPITEQLALAVQRGGLTEQMREQLQTMHNLYEISAAFLSQMRTNDVVFILLRTLFDLQDNTLATAFYKRDENEWVRTQVYSNHRSTELQSEWGEGPVWTDENLLLEDCRQEKMLVLASRKRAKIPIFWKQIQDVAASEVIYFPLSLPNRELFGVVGILLTGEHTIQTDDSALMWGIVQQGSAALDRVYLYEETRSSQSRLRAILESSRDGILLVENNQNIRYINGQALKLLNISSAGGSWEGQSWTNIIDALQGEAPKLAQWLSNHAEQLQQSNPLPLEKQEAPIFKTAHEVYLKVQHWPVYSETAKFLGALILLRDVTEQKMLEKMRDDLLHMLVHDMRNPLTLITNALDILDDPSMLEHYPEVIKIATQNADRILELVRAILEIGRLEAGLELHPEPIALHVRLKRIARELILSTSKVEFALDIPPEFPLLSADPEKVDRVFQNILDNALKFVADREGFIRIAARQIGDWAQIEVYNNGPPVPTEIMQRLFDKFVAGEYETRGYGLGLAFCRLVTEAHGGTIWAENHKEGGVSFFLTLPILDISSMPADVANG